MNDSPTFTVAPDPTRSLYIHVPFCRHRCGYCNFTLIAGRDDLIDRYLSAIETEISWLASRHEVQTVFLGGGTPSHLSPQQLDRLFTAIRTRFDFADGAEVAAECNPNDFDLDTLASFRTCGINRISFGAQSFDAEKLKFLQRDHSAADIRNAVELTKELTNNVSLDLIFATENESLQSWAQDLQAAVELEPVHLSTYELTIEKGTQFWNLRNTGSLNELPEDGRADMYEATIRFCQDNGFGQYEISSFAKPGFRCKHNLSYWTGTEYFAFGPGASKFVNSIRETNHRSTTAYLKLVEAGESPVTDRQVLSPKERALDRLVFGLRKTDGISLSEFQAATSYNPVTEFGQALSPLIEQGLLVTRQNAIRLTPRGIMVYDGIATHIMTEITT